MAQCNRVKCANAPVYIEDSAYVDTLDNKDITCVICKQEMLSLGIETKLLCPGSLAGNLGSGRRLPDKSMDPRNRSAAVGTIEGTANA